MGNELWAKKEETSLFTETIEAYCPTCHALLILNRRDDIGRLGPLSRQQIVCSECGSSFHVGGDCVNPPHELLWLESFEYKKRKRYTIALILLCQAYEMMFSSALRHILVFGLADAIRLNTEGINSLLSRLHGATEKCGYADLRNCLTKLVVRGSSPQSVEEAFQLIDGIHLLVKEPGDAWIRKNCRDSVLVDALIKLNHCRLNTVRNDVVHCSRYFPTRDEVQSLFDESEQLFPQLSYKLGLSLSRWEMMRY
jgi:hypothetical protein